MIPIATFDAAFRPTPDDDGPSFLASLGVELGESGPRMRPVSGAAQLTYARELHTLSARFKTVLTDRLRLSPLASPARSRPAAPQPRAAAEPAMMHAHRDREIRIVLAGQACFTLESPAGWATVLCGAGHWIALPPGLPHRCDAHPEQGADLLRLFSMPYGWASNPGGRALPPGWVAWPAVASSLSTSAQPA
jgi:cupin superfamily acireductone dioxygenase involved in methionine salvage